MSHVALVNVEIKDLDSLTAACKAMGFEFDRTATSWRWWGSWQNDYSAEQAAYQHGIPPSRYGTSDAGVIRIPGATWDVGVYKSPDGNGFKLVYDNFACGHGIEERAGAGLAKLTQRYATEVSKKQLFNAGFKRIREVPHPLGEGRIRLVATR